MGVFSCIGGDLLDSENQLRLHKPKIRFFLSEGVEFHSDDGESVESVATLSTLGMMKLWQRLQKD